MNPNLEQFLRKATRGVLGSEREIVREELRSNIEQLTLEYEEEGDSHGVALARAINEFGNPKTISAGMTRVHSLPKITRRVGLMAVLVALFITPFGSHHASVLATPWLDPRGTVYTFTIPVAELEAPLRRAGLRLKEVQNGLTLELGEEWAFASRFQEAVEVYDMLGALCRTGFPVGIDVSGDQVALLFGANRIELNVPSSTTQAWRAQRGAVSKTLFSDCNDVYTKL